MQIHIEDYHLESTFRKLSNELGGRIVKRYDIEIIQISNKLGEGYIQGINLRKGLNLWLFDMMLLTQISIKFIYECNRPFRIAYSLESEIIHSINYLNISYHLLPLSGSISASPYDYSQIFSFPVGKRIKFVLIEIPRDHEQTDISTELSGLPLPLKEAIKDRHASQPFLFQNKNSIHSAKSVYHLFNNPYEGYLYRVYQEINTMKMILQEALSYQVEYDSVIHKTHIKTQDLKRVIDAREILLSNFYTPFTIYSLAKKLQISESKLKRDFKNAFNETIYQYFINQKLQRAKQLLYQSKLNISQIAYQCGYSNTSKFIERFRMKFGITPKQFRLKSELDQII